MKKVVQAQLNWTLPEDGGWKNILPVGMRYCPMIVFEAEQSGDTLWSAELYNKQVTNRVSLADLSYLADDAPYHLLRKGSKFLLYEGQRVVAEGSG